MAQTFSLIGNPNITRRDIIPRITGQRRFSQDISAADIGAGSLTFMGLVTCPYPSAKIKSIDVSQAEAAGFATLTGAELPAYTYYGGSGRPYLPLDPLNVIFAGQPVAAVATNDISTVTDAINLVKVDYEPQPYVMDPEAALSSGAPQVYAGGNSIIGPKPIINANLGDVDSALGMRMWSWGR